MGSRVARSATSAPPLLLEFRLPVQHDGERLWRGIDRHSDKEPLAVWCDVVPLRDPTNARLEQPDGRPHTQIRRTARDWRGHQNPVLIDIEQLAAIATPGRLAPPTDRNLPFTSRRRKW